MSENQVSSRQKINKVPLHTTPLSYIGRAETSKNTKSIVIKNNRVKIAEQLPEWKTVMRRARIHRWRNTSDLSIFFAWKVRVDDELLKVITTKDYQDYFKLRGLQLMLPWSSFATSKGCESFLFNFGQTSRNIRQLSLDFAPLTQFTSQGLQVLKFLFRQYLINLSSYELEFNSGQSLQKEKLEELLSGIWRYLRDLKILQLQLSHCTDYTLLGKLSKIISALTKLRSLNLKIRQNDKVNNDFLRALVSKIIICLPNLGHLGLEFIECKMINDTVFKGFVSNLGKNLKQLTSLTLTFRSYRRNTDKALMHLGTELAIDMSHLQQLSLHFGSSTNITNKGFESLVTNIVTRLGHLRVLQLIFFSCIKITDVGIQALGDLLHQHPMPHLRNLTLNFCTGRITDNGLKIFTRELAGYLNDLNSLSLDFSYCKEITEDAFQEMGSSFLIRLTKLKTLSLNFFECFQVTESKRNHLKEKLHFIPNLEID